MPIDKPNFFLITGGPGVGKTALIEELRRRGERVVEETHRRLIRQQAAASGSALLGVLAAREDIARFEAMAQVEGRVFFDRGIIDSLPPQGAPPEWMALAARTCRYNPRVFVPPPWEAIYAQDEERKQTFEDCLAVHAAILRSLRELDYTPVIVPPGPVAARADFVLAMALAGDPSTGARDVLPHMTQLSPGL